MEIPENYQLFKFKNGDNVISETFASPDDHKHIILRRPMKIQIMMSLNEDGNPIPTKLVMTEWLSFAQEDTAIITRDNILCCGKPTKLIAAVYDSEKKRIDEMRENADTETPPPNELDKSDEQVAAEKKSKSRKNKKRNKMILMQMSLETLMRFLESMGLDIEEEPWKTMVNPPDQDEDDDEMEEDEEPSPPNLDGRMDIMPDVDGDGWVDPFGNPWTDGDPQ